MHHKLSVCTNRIHKPAKQPSLRGFQKVPLDPLQKSDTPLSFVNFVAVAQSKKGSELDSHTQDQCNKWPTWLVQRQCHNGRTRLGMEVPSTSSVCTYWPQTEFSRSQILMLLTKKSRKRAAVTLIFDSFGFQAKSCPGLEKQATKSFSKLGNKCAFPACMIFKFHSWICWFPHNPIPADIR